MSRKSIPKGLYAAMITPFDDDLRIDAAAMENQVDYLAIRGKKRTEKRCFCPKPPN